MIELRSVGDVEVALRNNPAVVVRRARLGERGQIRLAASLGILVGRRRGIAQVRYEDDSIAADSHLDGNEQWHADLSWSLEGPTFTVLFAVEAEPAARPPRCSIPARSTPRWTSGGATRWRDARRPITSSAHARAGPPHQPASPLAPGS